MYVRYFQLTTFHIVAYSHERSSDYIAAKHAVLAQLEDIAAFEQGTAKSVPLNKRVSEKLPEF